MIFMVLSVWGAKTVVSKHSVLAYMQRASTDILSGNALELLKVVSIILKHGVSILIYILFNLVTSQKYLPGLAFGVESRSRRGPLETIDQVAYITVLDSLGLRLWFEAGCCTFRNNKLVSPIFLKQCIIKREWIWKKNRE